MDSRSQSLIDEHGLEALAEHFAKLYPDLVIPVPPGIYEVGNVDSVVLPQTDPDDDEDEPAPCLFRCRVRRVGDVA